MDEGAATSVRMIRGALARLGVRPSRKRGQSFLADAGVARRIVGRAQVGPGDLVLEIGPGLGALTGELLRAGARVVAVESDRRLAGWLARRFAGEARLEIAGGDALRFDLAGLTASLLRGGEAVKVVSNIPYSVSTPLIARLLDSFPNAERFVLTVQDELARRITATPGGKEYGAFTIFCRDHAEVEKIMTIPPSVFYPAPGVTSAVLLFRPGSRKLDIAGERAAFFAFVRTLFSQRRKMVTTIVGGFAGKALGKSQAARILASLGIDSRVRPENMSPAQHAELYNRLLREGVLKSSM